MVQCLLDTEELDPAELAAIEKLLKAKRKRRRGKVASGKPPIQTKGIPDTNE
jgi:hypothetical protein